MILALSIHPLALSAESHSSAGALWVGASLLDFDYEEFDDQGGSFNKEQGRIPGVNAGFAYETPGWRLDGNLRWLSGDADYTSTAAESTTDEKILDLSLYIGLPLPAPGTDRLHLIAGGGYHTWWRNIRSTAYADGLDETYRWRYLLLGLCGEHRLNSGTMLTTELLLQRPINPELSVHFLHVFDDAHLDLEEATGFRIGFGVTRRLGEQLALSLAPWFEYWKLGRSHDETLTSGGIPAGVVFEPRSETRDFGIDLNLRWRFDL